MRKWDIVILLDVTSSMHDCIDAVKRSVLDLIASYSDFDVNGIAPITDWRMRIVGFRDSEADPNDWFVDNPFVSEVTAVQAQLLSENMKAMGGGDEPSSLLDALFKLATMDQVCVEHPVDQNKWREPHASGRAIIFFTSNTFKPLIKISEAAGGNVVEVITAITQNRIFLVGFGPEWEGYDALASIDAAHFTRVAKLIDTPALAGFGKSLDEVKAAQIASAVALNTAVTGPAVFRELLNELCKNRQDPIQDELA